MALDMRGVDDTGRAGLDGAGKARISWRWI